MYQDAVQGAITERNAWIFSFCDTVLFEDLDTGNYQEALRAAAKCTAEPAYVVDLARSGTSATAGSDSRLRVTFSRRLSQPGMRDISVNTPFTYIAGYKVYAGAVEDTSFDGGTRSAPANGASER